MAKYNETENPTINLISNGTDITGDIKSNGDIRIDGLLNGNLKTKGKLVIGETGSIKGEITCKNTVVEGSVNGKITVSELLTMKATSSLKGDINTRRLAIEPGAKFTGNCNMSMDANAATPNESEKSTEGAKKA